MTGTIAPQSALATTWLIAEREIWMRLRSKAFVISTAILLLTVLASIVIASVISGNAELDKVAAVGTAIESVEATQQFEVVEATDVAEAEELVRSGAVSAAVVPDTESPTGVAVIVLEDSPGGLIGSLSISPTLEILEPAEHNPFLVYIVSLGFGIIFFISALTFGQIIAQSVVEEKQTRIVEILMAAVPTKLLLAGKIIGNSLLAFAQIAGIAALAGVALLATGQDLILADIGPSLVWFVVFFAAGFVMLAALYAATAALVSRTEDLGSALTPVTLLVMIPYFGVIFFQDNDLVLAIMSYVPFSAPVGMPMRVFLGTAQWWEPLLSLAILVVSTVVVILIGSRIYANGLLRMGGRVKLKDALRA